MRQLQTQDVSNLLLSNYNTVKTSYLEKIPHIHSIKYTSRPYTLIF